MPHLITGLGAKSAGEMGWILPHEHVFVDIRVNPPKPVVSAADVIALMIPELEKARAAGVTGLVECTPVGVGRRVDILKAVSEAAEFPLIIPTGIYREPWIPEWVHDADEDMLYDWMLRELQDEIENTGVRAGWIKLSAGDDGITACEAKILRAAARAAKETGAVIGSHTVRARVVRDQLAIIESAGYTAERFIWIHAQAEADVALNLEMAKRGVWIEYDWIGLDNQSDESYISRIRAMLDAGFGNRILLSQDRGWYDPAQPGGGTPKPYTYLAETFLPKLRSAGIDEATIHEMTRTNPFNAFAR